MYSFTQVIKILSATGEEEKPGLMKSNGLANLISIRLITKDGPSQEVRSLET